MRPILLAASAALIAVVGLSVVLDRGPAADAQTTTNVAIGDNWFCNSGFANGGTCDTAITAGDSVLWTNTGTNPHTVTECGDAFAPCPLVGGFTSATLINGGTFSQTFPTAGTYEYWCAIHGNTMQGRVIVAAAQQTPTPSPTTSASPAPGSPTISPAGTGAATATPTRAPAAAPATGGSPTDGDASWVWLLAAFGGAIIVASAATGVGLLRRR